MIITHAFFDEGRSDNGGWNSRQLKALGIDIHRHGWRKRAIGMEVSDESAKMFLELKNAHLIKKTKQQIIEHNKYNPFNLVSVDKPLSRKEQYAHPNWQKKRLQIMERDEFTCMFCGSKQKQLHVHHNTYDAKLIWDCRNKSMITLCTDCHEKMHGRKFDG